MPSYAKKSPHSKRNGKKIKCNKFCAANKCRGKKTSMRRKKKKTSRKSAKQKINIEVSVSCGLARTGRKLGGAAWGGWCKWWGSN